MPEALYFTDSDEANALIAKEPLALLIGFALDQQITVQTAFAGPLKLKQRIGSLDARAIASMDPQVLEDAFRQRPGIHRFPPRDGPPRPGPLRLRRRGVRRRRRAGVDGGNGRGRPSPPDRALPGFGKMKVTALGSVLALRFGVEAAAELVPGYPTLGGVDSREALAEYQAKKRAHKASLRAAQTA